MKHSPERDPDPGDKPAGRDVLDGFPGLEIPQEPGRRNGRSAGYGAIPDIHRAGTGRIGGEHHRAGARRPWRHDGADRAPDHRGGIPLTELTDQATIDRLVQRTRDGGAEIVKYLKTGSAYYAPSAATVEMVESILKDKKKVLPCAAYLEGEYGVKGLFAGVPVKLGANGIEKIYQSEIDSRMSRPQLDKSAAAVKELIDVIKQKVGA